MRKVAMMAGAMSLMSIVAANASAAASRIYGAANIDRYLKQQKRDYLKGAGGSLAGHPHDDVRARARLARQIARGEHGDMVRRGLVATGA